MSDRLAPIEPGTLVRIKEGVRSEHVGVIATVVKPERDTRGYSYRARQYYWLTTSGRALGWFAASEFEVVAGPSS